MTFDTAGTPSNEAPNDATAREDAAGAEGTAPAKKPARRTNLPEPSASQRAEQPAVDREHRPGDERRGRAEQERSGTAEL